MKGATKDLLSEESIERYEEILHFHAKTCRKKCTTASASLTILKQKTFQFGCEKEHTYQKIPQINFFRTNHQLEKGLKIIRRKLF